MKTTVLCFLIFIASLYADAATWNKIQSGTNSGTVTTVSVASANGFAGTVATAGTTPAITLSTSITGLLKGNGTALATAAASDINSTFGSQTQNTFYAAPNGSGGAPSFRAIVSADLPVGMSSGNILSSSSALTANNVLITNVAGTGVTQLTSPASGVLTSAGSVPNWSSSLSPSLGGTGIMSYTTGDLLYASSSSALSKLSAGASGYVLMSNGVGTAPSWQAGGTGDFKANGSVTMTGPFKAADGASGAPSITFGNDTSTGLYLETTHWIGLSGNLNVAGEIDAGGNIMTPNSVSVGDDAVNGRVGLGSWTEFISGDSTGHYVRIATNNSERIRINSSGRVGIGTTNPGARLDIADTSTTTSAIIVPRAATFTGTNVNGMIRYNTTSTLFEFYQNGVWVNYTTVSDGRLKTNVEPVTHGLDIVNQLNPVFYDWDRGNPKATSFEDKHQVGFIAQEVEKVLPEVVNKGEDSYRSIEYGKIVSVVVAAVKELYRDLMAVKAAVVQAREEIASKADKVKTEAAFAVKDAKIKQLEQENAAIKAYLCGKDPKAAICK